MSLTKLLNRDEETMSSVNGGGSDDKKMAFLNQWNSRMSKILERDDKELDYQNWKFLSFQEFELISEWNQQGKDLTKDGCQKFIENMDQLKKEWSGYLQVKEQRESIITEMKESTQIIKQEPNGIGATSSRRKDVSSFESNEIVPSSLSRSSSGSNLLSNISSSNSSKRRRRQLGGGPRGVTPETHVQHDHKPKRSSNLASSTAASRGRTSTSKIKTTPSLDGKGKGKSNDMEKRAKFSKGGNISDKEEALESEENEEETVDNSKAQAHTMSEDGLELEDEDEGEVEESEEPEELEELGFQDDEEDDDFAPSYSTMTKVKINKKLNLESPIPAIQKELEKLAIKSSIVKAMKRKFTNCKIQSYVPESKLQVKITLKQLHIRKLKRHIAEEERKRKAEEALQQAEEEAKKRKIAPVQQKGKEQGLPTYGLKITLKEARAIQRHYDQTYITIWKDLARRDSGRISRQLQQIQSIRSQNFRKTSSLCAKEARRWQTRNFRQVKDFQTRARRGIREMSSFWKKNEREEREMKKKAEKEALEQAKREEEERENVRQAKKLNFLLTQTELYSHFIGSKIKTNELEGTMTDSSLAASSGKRNANIDISKTEASKTDIKSIDFDAEDDEHLAMMAAQNASNALKETQQKARAFDEEDENEELNFQNPTSLGEITIDQPKMLACTLKEYQLKGLNWLANLYDQGINGILADEMGLGKTVQSISVLAHLAERYNIWGPFIVVTPASTLHNWVNEIGRFVPEFKILPYWGNANDRKTLRKFWDRKHLRYGKNAPFHVMVTSYQMVVSDAAYLQKMKWQYMILDEAQAIKSSQSSRWKTLLSFHCRNRLLLTGTPIQNSMQELWALLHFIMPSLFDSHDEFSDWFSKDIESHAESNTELNQEQLRRLHMVLKPFMLRRIKKNVQSELGDKIEIDVLCDLTFRQAKLYRILRSQVSSAYDAIENAAGNDEAVSDQKLVNTVMEFRKVCNHPDLFERADVTSPFSFVSFGETASLQREGNLVDVHYSARNLISFTIPRLIYDDLIVPSYENDVDVRAQLLYHTMNIYHPNNSVELCTVLSKLTGRSPNDFTMLLKEDVVHRAIRMHDEGEIATEKLKLVYDEDEDYIPSTFLVENKSRYLHHLAQTTTSSTLRDLLNIRDLVSEQAYLNVLPSSYHPSACAPPINLDIVGCNNFVNRKQRELFDPIVSNALSSIPPLIQHKLIVEQKIPRSELPVTDLWPQPLNKTFSSYITMPSMDRFITESAKLKKLDEMLVTLKEEGHRVLIYFQMTRMMDLMEEYLTYRQYKHIRLDGSSKLDDRRDLVHDWQTKPEIFIFLLSTRAGGLGINLTAADTVIFYDSDWNPTIDSQAMDRAHRLGQTRQVTVYRLLLKGTIEERMRDRAKQKEHVQQVVMEGKAKEKKVQIVESDEKESSASY